MSEPIKLSKLISDRKIRDKLEGSLSRSGVKLSEVDIINLFNTAARITPRPLASNENHDSKKLSVYLYKIEPVVFKLFDGYLNNCGFEYAEYEEDEGTIARRSLPTAYCEWLQSDQSKAPKEHFKEYLESLGVKKKEITHRRPNSVQPNKSPQVPQKVRPVSMPNPNSNEKNAPPPRPVRAPVATEQQIPNLSSHNRNNGHKLNATNPIETPALAIPPRPDSTILATPVVLGRPVVPPRPVGYEINARNNQPNSDSRPQSLLSIGSRNSAELAEYMHTRPLSTVSEESDTDNAPPSPTSLLPVRPLSMDSFSDNESRTASPIPKPAELFRLTAANECYFSQLLKWAMLPDKDDQPMSPAEQRAFMNTAIHSLSALFSNGGIQEWKSTFDPLSLDVRRDLLTSLVTYQTMLEKSELITHEDKEALSIIKNISSTLRALNRANKPAPAAPSAKTTTEPASPTHKPSMRPLYPPPEPPTQIQTRTKSILIGPNKPKLANSGVKKVTFAVDSHIATSTDTDEPPSPTPIIKTTLRRAPPPPPKTASQEKGAPVISRRPPTPPNKPARPAPPAPTQATVAPVISRAIKPARPAPPRPTPPNKENRPLVLSDPAKAKLTSELSAALKKRNSNTLEEDNHTHGTGLDV
ncbi:MAG: hypothetical protein V4490_06865 [Pseudomonadota bacterium]